MDKAEFSRRVHAMGEQLYRVAYGQLREEQDRRDVVQEAILKAWQQRGRLRNADYFETWLIRILINECHNIQRAHSRLIPMERLPEREYADGGRSDLREALLALPLKLRLPVMLHYIEGYTTDEAARILAVPTGTVRSRLKKAREELKAFLEDD